jgi:hypothetical protein
MSDPATTKTSPKPTKAAIRAGWAKGEKPKKAAPAKPTKPVKPATPAKAAPAKPTPLPKQPAAPAKPAPVKAPATKVTFASRARELFAQGLDNDAIWAILRPEFGMEERQKGAVAWHRGNEARKTGVKAPNASARRAAAYDAALAYFIANTPKAAAAIGADKATYVMTLLATATGRKVEEVQTDLRAALAKG